MIKIDNIDQKAYEDGQWTEYAGMQFLVRPARNMAFTKALDRLQKPYRRNGRLNTDVETQTDLMNRAFAEAVLVDWHGVTTEDGSEVAYSVEAGIEALRDNPAFADYVAAFAGDLANFETEETEARRGK